MLTLALNKRLAAEIHNMRKRRKVEKNEDSSDPIYDPYAESKPNQENRCKKGNTNLTVIISKTTGDQVNFCNTCKPLTVLECLKDENSVEIVEGILETLICSVIQDSKKQGLENKTINIISNILIRAPDYNNIDINSDAVVKELLSDIIDSSVEESEKKRKKNFTKKGTIRKRKRFDTSLDERKKIKKAEKVSKRFFRETCNNGCSRKCLEKIDKERQNKIHSDFWTLTESQQRQFIFSAVKNTVKKKSCVGENSRRNKTVKYLLKDAQGLDFQVCKKFFLGTLGYPIHNDRIVRDVLSKTSVEELVVAPIKKGHPSEKKIDRINITDHIKSFNPTISHYRREHAPNRLYLPSDININLMHRDFLERNPENQISYELYRKEVRNMNISFAVLGHEECWQCESFENHARNSKHGKENIQLDCQQCISWEEHHNNAITAREEYKKDASIEGGQTNLFFSVDLQKVVMLPRCEMFKEIIFIRRIICFNESFVPLGKQTAERKPVAIIWHEGIAGRSQSDIISTFNKFLLVNPDSAEITLWLDNCASQNKNWALYSFLIYFINSEKTAINLLKLKYLQTGHTFMSADSFHHQVEKSLKQKKKVLDFQDYKDCVQSSNKGRTTCIEMQVDDFLDVKDFSSRFKINKTEPRPYLTNICEVNFIRGYKKLFYKTNFRDDLTELCFLTVKTCKEGVPQPPTRIFPRGIDKIRKQNLVQKLKDIVPKNRLKFWEELHESTEGTDLDV